jgi:hypothetical protein
MNEIIRVEQPEEVPKSLPEALDKKPTPLNDLMDGYARMFKMAEIMCQSGIVPKDFQGNPANCFIAIEVASRTNTSFLEVVQNLYVVHGKPAWNATFIISQINRSKMFDSPLRFISTGEGRDFAVTATTKYHGEVLSRTVSMDLAIREGWTSRKGNKYGTMAEQMLTYRSATFFARAYCPEVLFGMYTQDEIIDIEAQPI